MTDNAKKITELQTTSSPKKGDYLVIVSNNTGSDVTMKVTLSTLLGNNDANTVIQTYTPSSSTSTTVKKGTIFFDANYLYIATDTNTVKRVSLVSF